VDAKISISTYCNAKCKTCPVWEYPGQHMKLEDFKLMWTKLMFSKHVSRVLLNNTGDMYLHPQRKEIFDYIEKHHSKPVIMTTNAGLMDYVPKIDVIIISFNGGNKEDYEKTTGLNFDKTVARIKSHYPELSEREVEMHCLVYDGNAEHIREIKEVFSDFPGRIRLSFKYDNQMKVDHTLENYKTHDRMPCDYLHMLSVLPSGKVISCAHDFEGVTDFGNIFTEEIYDLVLNRNRMVKQMQHLNREYTGLCKKCNYNTSISGKIEYIK